MRWRLIDRVRACTPWAAIEGEKCVSLEEYFLQERIGRRGTLPESLLLGSFVELGRWLVCVSTGFTESALLNEIEELSFFAPAAMGTRLDLRVRVVGCRRDEVVVEVEAVPAPARGSAERTARLAAGRLVFTRCPLSHLMALETARRFWGELRGPAA